MPNDANYTCEYVVMVTVEAHNVLCDKFHDFIDMFLMFYKGI